MANKSRYSSLTKSSDFAALKKDGHVAHVNSWLLINWRRGADERIRCGWTIPGHIGGAVTRNRFKRWGREFFRNWAQSGAPAKGLDVNVILKRRPEGFYLGLSHKEFDEGLSKATAKLR